MNRREMLAGTTVVSAGIATGPLKIDGEEFGVAGDGVADDAAAIQAALDHVGKHGGGTVVLPSPKVHYRIGRGLKLPSDVTLEGVTSVQYPFNAGNRGVCALVADFDDIHQWVIEPATQQRRSALPFDGLINDALPDGVTYNCGVKNLLVTSKGKIPFGGIRMHGCPGATVDGVSIDRMGCGLLVNYSFGGSFRVHVHTLYYGVAAWDDANANTFQIYCSHSVPWPRIVPDEYRLPFMRQLDGHFADTLKLSDDRHGARPYGLLCGSIRSTSIGNIFDVVIERFPGGIFMFNAYATDIRRCYLEADAGIMECGIAATRSRFSVQALHAYLSGTGTVFDFGINVLGKILGSGILHAAAFGKLPVDDGSSLLLLEGVDPEMPGASFRRGVRYACREAAWVALSLQAGWRAAGGDYEEPSVMFDPWTHQVELRGTMSNGGAGVCFVLPPACRPAKRRRCRVAGGELEIGADGVARITPDEKLVSLDAISFARW